MNWSTLRPCRPATGRRAGKTHRELRGSPDARKKRTDARHAITWQMVLAAVGRRGGCSPHQPPRSRRRNRTSSSFGATTSASSTSAPTTWAGWATGRRTSDSIAQQGALFTDWYGQQSCTAGRAAFITGQSPIRTGLTKVGLPSAPEGIRKEDPTLAELLKPLGYATGQFGKNHLGDRNDMLPTVHGFDEWLGNLYHLNAEEEPENVDYPKDPSFKARFGPRGVMHCFATDKDDPTDDPRFGRVGKQRCEDTGPLTVKRMETVDRGSHRGGALVHGQVGEGRQAVLRLVELLPHARLHAPQEGKPGQDGSRDLRGRHGRARWPGRPVAGQAQGVGHRRQHHRHVLQRQRCGVLQLARRRLDDVPRREEHAMGGRLPRPLHDSLARRHQARRHHRTTWARTKT